LIDNQKSTLFSLKNTQTLWVEYIKNIGFELSPVKNDLVNIVLKDRSTFRQTILSVQTDYDILPSLMLSSFPTILAT
jgi:hypothetical protein